MSGDPKNIVGKGGRPAGRVDYLSKTTKDRLLADLYARAKNGDADAALALLRYSDDAERERKNGTR